MTTNIRMPEAILAAFAAAGLPLDYFEDIGLYQYDGFDHGNNITVQLNTGVNGLGRNGIFGEYYANDNTSYGLSCCMDDWLECFGEYLPKMAKGEGNLF